MLLTSCCCRCNIIWHLRFFTFNIINITSLTLSIIIAFRLRIIIGTFKSLRLTITVPKELKRDLCLISISSWSMPTFISSSACTWRARSNQSSDFGISSNCEKPVSEQLFFHKCHQLFSFRLTLIHQLDVPVCLSKHSNAL